MKKILSFIFSFVVAFTAFAGIFSPLEVSASSDCISNRQYATEPEEGEKLL